MNVSGKHVFKVERETLWNYLMDPEVLAKIMPGGTSKLERIDDNSYKSVTNIKIGPVKGAFSGKLHLKDKKQPESFTIEMEQLSKIGNAHADMVLELSSLKEGHTELSFNADAKLSGLIARTGQRVLSGVANTVTKDIFASIEKHIEEQQAS